MLNTALKGKPLFLWQMTKTCTKHLCSDGCDFAKFSVWGYPKGTFDKRAVVTSGVAVRGGPEAWGGAGRF